MYINMHLGYIHNKLKIPKFIGLKHKLNLYINLALFKSKKESDQEKII